MVAALEQVRVLDLSDDRAIYAGKLLGDLGAQVLRLEPPDGDPLRRRGPHMNGRLDGESLWYAFFASSRTPCALRLRRRDHSSACGTRSDRDRLRTAQGRRHPA